MRSGRLLGTGLDGDAVQLAAAGLVRLTAEEWLGGAAGAPAWFSHVRAASFADTWLAFGETAAPGLRVPARAVVRSVARLAAELVLQARAYDDPATLEWLGRESAEARDRARRDDVSHPAEPAALALVWHGVQAAADDEDATAEGRESHDRRITERAEAYVRERHHRQDTLALLLACARIAATALQELSSGDRAEAARHLDELAGRHMPHTAPVPLWVPGRPDQAAA
ncbi:hypothetical protein RMN57_36635 [Kitasatospora sp. CM 4170]|uniref:Uncharacterized protein n=1 Tax=Kitasatospora aburaviensis TaxID=67265 RepID=A0ABW1F643_9ACTN|nr:hypothetical protein [Kitasatospora sp. CM 4170]WNM49840.1 hypothetical protein RMN57_36635 [Kitasatospora sp. CM 4170]